MATTSWDITLNPQWLARRCEDIIDPKLAIVDAHHHVWDRPGYRYLLDEMLADTGSSHNIQATVFVSAGPCTAQTAHRSCVLSARSNLPTASPP
jgi:hypothetical protein